MANKYEANGIKYLNIKIDDTECYKISLHFEEVYNFMEEVLGGKEDIHSDLCEIYKRIGLKHDSISTFQDAYLSIPTPHKKNRLIQLFFRKLFGEGTNNNKILIHCSLGMSRSPTMACMYLMKKLKLSFEEVLLNFKIGFCVY
jgi:hypothetical protein